MTRRGIQLVILCEDQQQEFFARHFFLSRGFPRQKIRVRKSPKGKGSGEQYVREHYPQEVEAYRSRSAYRSVGLAVVIDADTQTVEQRLVQLDSALEVDSQQRRQPEEKIAVFVPKRNIETWIHYLKGQTVDEETVYPRLSRERECKPYVQKLARDICASGLAEDAPPSLHTACDELQRILPSNN